MISESYIASSSSTTVPNISNVISAKLLQDSGYRSTISNFNFEEEIVAFGEKERKEERDLRRRQQRRKNGGAGLIF